MLADILNQFLLFFEQGGLVMPPLVIITLSLWYALGYRYHILNRGNKYSVRVLIEKYMNGYDKQPSGIIDSAVVTGLKITLKRKKDIREPLDVAFYAQEVMIGKYSQLIMTLVAVAPLLGLLGTVIGMIETFDSLADSALFAQGGGGIAGGISQALFTTQMGLVVAVPGLVMGRLLSRKEDRLATELDQIKDILCSDLKVLGAKDEM